MAIGFSCDGCGQCDECLGIIWPSPEPMTKKQRKDMLNMSKRWGQITRRNLDNQLIEMLKNI